MSMSATVQNSAFLNCSNPLVHAVLVNDTRPVSLAVPADTPAVSAFPPPVATGHGIGATPL